jgi:hypothetical protein
LAESLVLVASGAGLPTTALLTDMNQPLASAAGNAIEVAYVVDYLTGRRREPRFHEVTVALGPRCLYWDALRRITRRHANRLKRRSHPVPPPRDSRTWLRSWADPAISSDIHTIISRARPS